jgi:hypothetical protein
VAKRGARLTGWLATELDGDVSQISCVPYGTKEYAKRTTTTTTTTTTRSTNRRETMASITYVGIYRLQSKLQLLNMGAEFKDRFASVA